MKKLRLAILLGILGLGVLALSQRSALQAWAGGVERRATRLIGKPAPELPRGLTTLDGPPITLASLKGKVVLLHYWTFGCSNCKAMVPHFNAWAKRGVTVLGVHTPEFDWEKKIDRLRSFVTDNQITWPVIIDEDMAAWDRHLIDAWPTILVIDKAGIVRQVAVGDDSAPSINATLSGDGIK
jgi:thiol-disulfide isomerase/thioredoxin